MVTSWLYSAITAIWYFFNLYLRALEWDYIIMGIILTIVALVSTGSRILSGYLGDVWDRKKLSVIAMLIASIYHIIIGLFTDILLVFIGLMLLGLLDIPKSGSSAYLLENIPQEHSGFGLSIFRAGNILGILVLIIFGILVPITGFQAGFRLIYLGAGLILLVCTITRQRLLQPSPRPERERTGSLFRDFLSENARAIKHLIRFIPVVILIASLDAMSDSMFRFGALLYTNETLGIDILGINIIIVFNLIISVPLMLIIGRYTDRKGLAKAMLVIYAFMPVSALLLLLASYSLYWAPLTWVTTADSLIEGLSVFFSLPFIGLILKYVNDALWGLILMTIVHMKLPKEDTAKFLAVFWFIVYACSSFGPFIGGIIMTYFGASLLFVIVLILNLCIIALIARTDFSEKQPQNN